MSSRINKYYKLQGDYSNYPDASLKDRSIAFVIDLIVISSFQALIISGTKALPLWPAAQAQEWAIMEFLTLDLLVYIITPSAYFFLQTSKRATTFGKKAMKLKVIHQASACEPDRRTSVKREIIGRILSLLPLGLGHLMPFVGLRTFHDQFAGTRVISLRGASE